MMKRALPRGALACALFLCARAAWPAPTELRYQCDMPDGTTLVMAQDLSEMFESASTHCTTVQAQAAAPPEEPPAPPPPLQAARRIVEISQEPLLAAPYRRDPNTSIYAGPGEFEDLIRAAGLRHGVDPALLAALIYVESRFQANARSPKGALGLMQIMPATGTRYGVALARSLMVPAINVDVGTRYVRDLLEMFAGRLDLAIAAYNAGEGAVAKYGNRVPPFAETQDYVTHVLSLYGSPTMEAGAARGR